MARLACFEIPVRSVQCNQCMAAHHRLGSLFFSPQHPTKKKRLLPNPSLSVSRPHSNTPLPTLLSFIYLFASCCCESTPFGCQSLNLQALVLPVAQKLDSIKRYPARRTSHSPILPFPQSPSIPVFPPHLLPTE
jgi:hypothetical protein